MEELIILAERNPKFLYITMEFKQLANSARVADYQTPSFEMICYLEEQAILTGSNVQLNGNGPEGYTVDDDEFNW